LHSVHRPPARTHSLRFSLSLTAISSFRGSVVVLFASSDVVQLDRPTVAARRG
jgi:hypothetical protein